MNTPPSYLHATPGYHKAVFQYVFDKYLYGKTTREEELLLLNHLAKFYNEMLLLKRDIEYIRQTEDGAK